MLREVPGSDPGGAPSCHMLVFFGGGGIVYGLLGQGLVDGVIAGN